MTDWILYGKCETCPRKRFFIRKRWVKLPIGQMAKSQKKICGHCYKKVLAMLATNNGKDNA